MPTRAAKRALARRGTEVDMINRTKDDAASDEYADKFNDDAYSGNPVSARVVRGDGTEDRSQYGSRVDADAEVFVSDDVSGITDGGGDDATRIDVDRDGDVEYKVLVEDQQENGLTRLACERVGG